LTRLFYVLEDQKMLNDQVNTAPADVLIIPMTEELDAAIALATRLRGEGIRTQLYTEQKKFKQKIAYAAKLGIPFAVFLGEDEIAQNVVTLKDLTCGQQSTLSFEEAVAQVQAKLAQERAVPSILG
jgi:histidyl-tRNA synthetase